MKTPLQHLQTFLISEKTGYVFIEPLIEGNYYHIFNRGINRQDIFLEEANYFYFLKKYQEYLSDVVDTLAYCLLRNHFHVFVYVKENVIIQRNDGKGSIKLNASKQFGHLFNSYAQSFNKVYDRTGSLFESPFHRKCVTSESYLSSLFFYIHTNAQHHQLVKDFREWPFSSYHELLGNLPTFVDRDWVLDWFGGRNAFIEFHSINQELLNPQGWMLEDD